MEKNEEKERKPESWEFSFKDSRFMVHLVKAAFVQWRLPSINGRPRNDSFIFLILHYSLFIIYRLYYYLLFMPGVLPYFLPSFTLVTNVTSAHSPRRYPDWIHFSDWIHSLSFESVDLVGAISIAVSVPSFSLRHQPLTSNHFIFCRQPHLHPAILFPLVFWAFSPSYSIQSFDSIAMTINVKYWLQNINLL